MSALPNFKNRTLFHGDNLKFLRAMNSESVDLIATDPPFNKNRDFHATPDSLAKGAKFQDRWSWEKDVHEEWVDEIKDDHPRLMEAIESARYAHSDGMGAYMCFMAVRLLAMRRVLKPTGSIYLHCDPTASHYLKAVMDAVFGWKNFQNEIVWKRYAPHSLAGNSLDTICDVLLFYTKSSKSVWNGVYGELTKDETKRRFPYIEEKTGRRYQHIALEQSSNKSSAKETRIIQGKEIKGTIGWRWTQETFDARLKENSRLIHWTRAGRPRYKKYADEYAGVPVGNLWCDVEYLSSGNKERTGYPTQKPLALYERIIKASSSSNSGGGDMVLDPFAGCATTCVAAERLNRQWVGIDIWEKAHEVVVNRLRKEVGLFGDVTFTDELPERTDDGETASPYLRVKEKVKEPEGPKWSRAEMYEHLLEQQGWKCQGCDREFDDQRYLELDHNVPRSDRGINHISNRILLCGPCNKLKSNIYTLSGLRNENRKRGYMAKQ